MAREAIQTWCAVCQWPGREEFLVGTFTTPYGTPDQEAREAALKDYQGFMGRILPVDVPAPEVLRLIPGAVIFTPRECQ